MIKLVIIFLSVLLLDQGSKFAVYHFVPSMKNFLPFPHGGRALFQSSWGIDAAIVNSSNTGAAWGLLADHQEFLMGIRVTIVVGILFWLLFLNKKGEYILAFSLIVSGAISNILDFFLYGHVVDMFYFRFWGYVYPIFNVADTCITIGALLLAASFLRSKKA